MSIHDVLSKKASEIEEDIICIRRHLHMYPELSGEEKETSLFVAEKLKLLGLDVQTNIGGYGVVGILKGAKPGATVAWRADMDASPMQEANDKPYRSRNDGVMHLCGHDAHTAIALGIAETLAAIREDLHGNVKFIFQPFEEGTEGALRMIKDGVLENPRPCAVYGLHQSNWGINQTYLESGTLSLNYGTVLFGCDRFNIKVKVNRPKVNLDAEQSILIFKLNTLNRYNIKQCSNATHNTIEFKIVKKEIIRENSEFSLQAQFRYAMQKYRDEIREELLKILEGYAEQSASEVSVNYYKSIPPVYNNEAECKEAEFILKKLIGDDLISIHDETPPHGTDDYACFQNELSGLFFFLGSANLEKGIMALTHTALFDLDEKCLLFAVKTMSSFLYEIMRQGTVLCRIPHEYQVPRA
jgi:amidohydrolase